MNTETTKLEKKVLLAIVSIAMLTFMGIVSETALNVAFPILIKEFNVVGATIQWLTTGYLLIVAILVPISPMLVKRFPTKRLFQTAACIFTIGTIFCGLATSFPLLLVGRLIQATGTGISLPLMFNIILALVPMNKRGVVMGMAGLVTSFAPALGPTYGGIIVTTFGWQWIFILLLPIAIVAITLGSFNITTINELKKIPFDFISIGLSALAFSGIIYGFSTAGEIGWQAPVVIGSLATGFVSLVIFSWRQLTIEKPLVDLKVFKFPMFVVGLSNVFLVMMIILSCSFLLPIYTESVFGVNATTAGMMMLPASVLSAIMAPIAGRILDINGPKKLITIGTFISLMAITGFLFFTSNLVPLTVILLHMLLLLGASLTFIPSQTNGLNQLPEKMSSDGTATISTLQQVAGAVGTSLVAGIVTTSQIKINNPSNTLSKAELTTAGVHNSFILLFILAGIGFTLSFFIKKK